MDPKAFGGVVEAARAKTGLTQAALAELMSIQSGIEVSQQAVGYWCQGSRVPRDRFTLLALLHALYSKAGLGTREEINTILLAAGAGALHETERLKWFPALPPLQEQGGAPSPGETPGRPAPSAENHPFWLRLVAMVFRLSDATIEQIQRVYTTGPQPRWAGLFLLLSSRLTTGWTAERVLAGGTGVLLVLGSWLLTYPPLRWMPLTGSDLQFAVMRLVAGALLVPLGVAAVSRTKDDPFWVEKALGNDNHVRLFTHLGAALGFQVGYTLLFFVTLLLYHLKLHPLPLWLELLLSGGVLVWSYTAARQVPYNMLRAYGAVQFRERDIPIAVAALAMVPGLGGLYGVVLPFFLDPWTGTLLLLGTFMALAGLTLWYQKKGDGSIPTHSWAAVAGSAAICWELSRFSYWIFPAILTGLTVALVYLLAQARIRITNYGMVATPLVLLGVGGSLMVNLVLGRILTVVTLIGWLAFGRKYLWFPLLFWIVIGLAALCVSLWSRGVLTDPEASLVYGAGCLLGMAGDWLWCRHRPVAMTPP